MDQKVIVPVEAVLTQCASLPVSYVPTPSAPYRQHRKNVQLTLQPGMPRPNDIISKDKTVVPLGSRVLIWKQDPSVSELGTRKAFLPGLILQGPRDARIVNGVPGIPPVSPNAFGDFIMSPNTDQFDAIHTFAVVRQTLTMYQRALARNQQGAPLPWQWNNASNTDPLKVFPHGLPNVMNAYYSRSDKALKFGDFVPSGGTERVYTCRSFDIVSHETGHAVLDGLKPQWLLSNNPPQTGGLHESFGDLTAIFLALSQLDQVEAVIAQTKADLHDKTFLADLAEQFGLALGRANGLRNADNDFKLSQVSDEVHAISQVFTGAIYDILADIFAYERNIRIEDDAAVLHRCGDYLRSLVLRALIGAPDVAATYADVANQMLLLAAQDGKPQQYHDFIYQRFNVREVLGNAPLTAQAGQQTLYEAGVQDHQGLVQDRRGCCGTMTNAEYFEPENIFDEEREALAAWCRDYGAHRQPANGHANGNGNDLGSDLAQGAGGNLVHDGQGQQSRGAAGQEKRPN
ncbi:hypothetical protein [Janthinobacterium agaricidamnosum]|uniref:Peptidase M4 domain-containing protein n=1 Tax=Janthinobacterium agaricidamnosum NBRC 102515 = DSM 9628 TaxID=1349767 RepID=W0V832_9BURK|nr:hypothetical protein [Janthinobacterium agaricidamnosum]CDG84964.1 hypothetical protein GJA_4356 [Janthinobacterium agaricidamnosum NBRC 102515 = DSM 9628]